MNYSSTLSITILPDKVFKTGAKKDPFKLVEAR